MCPPEETTVRTEDTPRNGVRTVVVPERSAPSGIDAVKVYDFLLVVLGMVGAAVSGWSIGTLLHDNGRMPWYFAVLGVGVYDLLAFMAGLMVYIRRAEPHRAVGAQILMLASIGGSAYVNYMHGREIGGDLVALVFGAAPVVFEVAFAMRHNVLSVVTAILFPGTMWRRYKDGVWIKLHTGSLPLSSALVPEASGSPSDDLPEVPEALPTTFRKPSEASGSAVAAGTPVGTGSQVTVVPELPEVDSRKPSESDLRALDMFDLPEAMAEVLPLHSRKLPETPEARAEAVAEALRNGDRITGVTVGAMYGVSDSMGRQYIRRAKEINASREDA